MKKTLLIMVMALAVLLTQCRKPEVKFPSPVAPEGTTVSMTVTAGPGGKTDISETGAITWSTGDQLYVGDGAKYIGCLTLQGAGGSATGTFSGDVTLTDISEGTQQTFHFFYLGSNPPAVTSGASSVEVSFAEQTGLRENLGSCHVGYGSAKGTVSGGVVTDINVTMVSKVAIAYFDFKDGTPEGYSGAIELSGANICNSMTVGFNGSFSGTTDTEGNAINLTSTSSSKKYVMLVPTTSTTGSQTLNFGGGVLGGTKTLENGIEANKFYGRESAIAVTLDHEYVDLGLSVKWATCNVGADRPEGYGWYFMWGSVTEGGDSYCKWEYCPGNGEFNYYNAAAYNTWKAANLIDDVLNSDVDAAHVNWGGGWRMPTEEEWQELYDNTTSTWTTEAGVYGCKFTNETDSKYIFLPAAGFRYGTNFYNTGSSGYYWASSLSSNTGQAYNMYFKSDKVDPQYSANLCNGFSVRPVRAAQ